MCNELDQHIYAADRQWHIHCQATIRAHCGHFDTVTFCTELDMCMFQQNIMISYKWFAEVDSQKLGDDIFWTTTDN